MKTIIITVEMDVPDHATDADISDFVDVEYGHVNSMKNDNPCLDDEIKIHEAAWKYEK